MCRPYLDASLCKSSVFNQAIYSHRLSHIVPGQYTSIPSILQLTNSIGTDLAALDLFSSIDAKLQPSTAFLSRSDEGCSDGSSSSSSSSSAALGGAGAGAEEDVDIVLTVQEKGNYFLKTSTDVGNGEGNATVQGRIRNCFGGAERLDLSATMGTKTRRAYNVSHHFEETEREKAFEGVGWVRTSSNIDKSYFI